MINVPNDEDQLFLMNEAVGLVKQAGFVLNYSSLKSEACYYQYPGHEGVLRIATHRYGGKSLDYGVTSPVLSCLTFSKNMNPKTMDGFITSVALAIGRYFIAGASVSRWRKK